MFAISLTLKDQDLFFHVHAPLKSDRLLAIFESREKI